MFIQFLFAQMFPVSRAGPDVWCRVNNVARHNITPSPLSLSWALYLRVFIARIKTGRRNQMPISLRGTSRNWPNYTALTHELITTIQKR